MRQHEAERAEERRDFQLFVASAAAHASALLLSKLASAPFERAKICFQVQTLPVTNAIKFVRYVCSEQGAMALWRGTGAHLGLVSTGALVRLNLLRTSQMWTMPGGEYTYTGVEAYLRRCVFLYGSGAAALVVAYPLDLAYTNLAADMASRKSQQRSFRSAVEFYRHVMRQHGVFALYRGLPMSLVTAVPFVATATFVHDLLAQIFLQGHGQVPQTWHWLQKNWHLDIHQVDDGDLAQPDYLSGLANGVTWHLYPRNLLVGAGSGFVAQVVTYPLDTWRRRWQHTCSSSNTGSAASLARTPRNSLECLFAMIREGGIRTFYKGFWMNAAKLVPELLVLCGVYMKINASGRINV